jgi:hypothetical protein
MIRQAEALSEAMQYPARWICADVLATPAYLDSSAVGSQNLSPPVSQNLSPVGPAA